MYKIILFAIIFSIPATLRAELIELKCTGDKYVYDADLKPTIHENTIQTIIINTKTKRMDIIIGVKSKTVNYADDKSIIRVKFIPDVFALDDKILYEVTKLNRYTGEIFSSYKFINKDVWNHSFIGQCEPTKRRF